MTEATPQAHLPVLLDDVVRLLAPAPGACMVDCTVGAGGHARALLDAAGPTGRLLGIDKDPEALKAAAQALESCADRADLVQGDFRDIGTIMAEKGLSRADVILFDLGVSSMQLDRSARGFSFLQDGPLDMRMNPSADLTAADVVNTWDEERLADLIYTYGEDRLSRRIARAICRTRAARPIHRTAELAQIIAMAVPSRYTRIHPATRTFQALRIAVNDELGALETALAVVPSLLAPGGRLGVIAFHSLEDRIVKRFVRDRERDGALTRITRKPVTASDDEIRANPRSRSAKLRVAEATR